MKKSDLESNIEYKSDANPPGASPRGMPKIASFQQLRQILGKVQTGKWERDSDLNLGDHGGKGPWITLYLATQALGVVFGDIGTSPLYVYASTFQHPPSEEDVLGAMSLIFWTITLIVLVKYALIVLNANDHGNGGTFALFALLKRAGDFRTLGKANKDDRSVGGYQIEHSKHGVEMKVEDWRQRLLQSSRLQSTVRFLVVIGVGAIMGDGVLTPAISVLSACEGIRERATISENTVIGITCAILAALFLIQRFGTTAVGFLFSPIVFIWLVFNGGVGIANLARFGLAPIKALSPHYIITFMTRNGVHGWRSLGGTVLSVTGAEALYADLGHFGKPGIQLALFALVYPCLVLTYLGQSAFLMHGDNNLKVSRTFWASLPSGTETPMLVAATLAAIVASQALISAVFQVVYQAVAQDFFPNVSIIHTSKKVVGQVYVPVVNYVLMVLTLAVVIGFKTSANLGQAYGLAVLVDMLLTTQFITLLMVTVWRLPVYLALPFHVAFTFIEGVYLSSSLEKIPKGGWFTVMMAAVYSTLMMLWFWGVSARRRYFTANYADKWDNVTKLLSTKKPGVDGQLEENSSMLSDTLYLSPDVGTTPTGTLVYRCPGIGLYYSQSIYGPPPVLVQHLRSFPAVHQINIFLTNRYVPIPSVSVGDQLLVNQLEEPGFYHAIVRYGYCDPIDQGDDFVERLTEHVLKLLFKAFLYRLASSRELQDMCLTENSKNQLGVMLTAPATVQALLEKSGHMDSRETNGNGAEGSSHGGSMGDEGSWPQDQQSLQHTISAAVGKLHPARHFNMASITPTQQEAILDAAARLREMARDRGSWAAQAAAQDTAVQRALLLAREFGVVLQAQTERRAVYVLGCGSMMLNEKSNFFRRVFMEMPFSFLVNNIVESSHSQFGVPLSHLCEIALPYHL